MYNVNDNKNENENDNCNGNQTVEGTPGRMIQQSRHNYSRSNSQLNFSFSRELFWQRLRLQEYAARTARLFSLRRRHPADKIRLGQEQ